MGKVIAAVFAVIAVFILALLLMFYQKVPAGHVGVKVHLLGTDKGVDMEELGVGRYLIGINQELFLFPTFTQNHTYDGRNVIGFQTKEGLSVQAPIGVSYYIDPAKVSSVFQKYRRGVDEITEIYMRNMIRDALVKKSSVQTIESVYGSGKTELIESVFEDVRAQLAPIGIMVEKVFWVGELVLPETVIQSIDSKIMATQLSEQRENEIRQAAAEARKLEEKANGEANAILRLAKAEAEAISIKGDALRNNPQVIDLNKVERWNGVLPTFVGGGAVPMIQLN